MIAKLTQITACLGTAALTATLSGQGFNDVFDVDTNDINSIGYFQSGNFGDNSAAAVMDGSHGHLLRHRQRRARQHRPPLSHR
ncbi:MAG: hypothetical protein JJU00_19755 [Opitutales bacterium]|nr:hypothetical protein [Opitutales bacterium]